MNNPFDYFENIFCINLDKRVDRWKESVCHFESLGIKDRVQRFSAIDYESVQKVPKEHKGKFGCTHSHIELIRQAKEKNLPNVLIFEDDVHLHKSPEETKQTLDVCIKELPKDWEIFYLSCNPLEHPRSIENYSNNLCMIRLAFTTHAMAINNTAYDYILRGAKTAEDVFPVVSDAVVRVVNIDGYYMNVVLPHEKSYMPKKLLFTQRNSFSDIDFDKRDINTLIVNRYKQFNLLQT